jgi:hypothetical protein
MRKTKILILSFVILLVSSSLYAKKYEVSAFIGKPLPHSKPEFKSYRGNLTFGGSYSMILFNKFALDVELRYSSFESDESKTLNKANYKTYLFVIRPEAKSRNREKVTLDIRTGIGWAWMSLKREQNNSKFNESGFLILPSLRLLTPINKKILLFWDLSYPIVFEDFGEDALKDESTTRWFDFTIGLSYFFKI